VHFTSTVVENIRR